MKKLKTRAFVSFIFSILISFIAPIAQAKPCIIIMRWNDDAPYAFLTNPSSKIPVGISIDIAKKALENINCQIRYAKMPWARGLIELRSGRIDLISSAFKTPERSTYAHFSSIGFFLSDVIFVRTVDLKKWHFNKLSDLKDKEFMLGVQINVSYGKEFDNMAKSEEFRKHLVFVSRRESLWKMLSLKRLDGVLGDKTTGLLELKDLSLRDTIKTTELILPSTPGFFAFSKKTTTPSFVDKFDAALRKMQNNGEITKINNHYLN